MFMDNVMDSVTDIPTAIKLRRDLTELLALAGMRIHNWCSNETAVIEDIPEDDRVTDRCPFRKWPVTYHQNLGVLWQSMMMFSHSVLCNHQPMKSLQKEKWLI